MVGKKINDRGQFSKNYEMWAKHEKSLPYVAPTASSWRCGAPALLLRTAAARGTLTETTTEQVFLIF